MWNRLSLQKKGCRGAKSRTQELLNRWAGTGWVECQSAADEELRRHLDVCPDCRADLEQFLAARQMLRRNLKAAEDPGAEFTNRVMRAAAAAAERSAPASNLWPALPGLASRMAWICAVALLLVAAWLYETRAFAPVNRSSAAGEMALDSDGPADGEEVLESLARSEP